MIFLSIIFLALNIVSQFMIAGYHEPGHALIGSGIQLLFCFLCLLLSGMHSWNALKTNKGSGNAIVIFLVINAVNALAAYSPMTIFSRNM